MYKQKERKIKGEDVNVRGYERNMEERSMLISVVPQIQSTLVQLSLYTIKSPLIALGIMISFIFKKL